MQGTAQLRIELAAYYFNAANGFWEPIVEPWGMNGHYVAVRVPVLAPTRASADGPAEPPAAAERVEGEEQRTLLEHSVTLSSHRQLELNISHACVSLGFATLSLAQVRLRCGSDCVPGRTRACA